MGDLLCQLARSRLLEPTSELATRQGRSGLSVLAEAIRSRKRALDVAAHCGSVTSHLREGDQAVAPRRDEAGDVGPSTAWLNGQLAVDEDGFVLNGADIPVAQLESVEHLPLLLETSRPGIFCVGDVRSRSVKRVATAIGEGSMAVRLVFDRLQATGVAS